MASEDWSHKENAIIVADYFDMLTSELSGKQYIKAEHNRTVRQEWLGQYIFHSIEEAQEHATRWLWICNNERPNMAIGGAPPGQKLKMAA